MWRNVALYCTSTDKSRLCVSLVRMSNISVRGNAKKSGPFHPIKSSKAAAQAQHRLSEWLWTPQMNSKTLPRAAVADTHPMLPSVCPIDRPPQQQQQSSAVISAAVNAAAVRTAVKNVNIRRRRRRRRRWEQQVRRLPSLSSGWFHCQMEAKEQIWGDSWQLRISLQPSQSCHARPTRPLWYGCSLRTQEGSGSVRQQIQPRRLRAGFSTFEENHSWRGGSGH